MRLITSTGVITSVLLAACSGDLPAPTSPTTTAPTTMPSFSSANTLSATHVTAVSLSCSNAAPESDAGFSPDFGTLTCGTVFASAGITSFGYKIDVKDASLNIMAVCTALVSTTGSFTCKSQKWSAKLTVTDLGPAP
jgi:hypothetical protein